VAVADVQQRIAMIQATVASFAPAKLAAATPGFANELSRVLRTDNKYVAASNDTGKNAVALAKEYLGTPYVWGGEEPGGFDCSGLMQHVYEKLGIDLPRVSRDQAKAGVEVALADLKPGDLVFFGEPVDHVGMYAGDGRMVVAPKRGDVVKIQDINFSKVTAARRVVPSHGGIEAGLNVAAMPATGRQYAEEIKAAAAKAGIDPALLAALAWSESGFRADAQSGAGAIGLTQLMPATAAGMNVDPADPAQNLEGGARYLAVQLRRFGRVDLALAAYNAGPTAVSRAGGIPPYQETQNFVRRVMERMELLS
jgi:hypothetical protein